MSGPWTDGENDTLVPIYLAALRDSLSGRPRATGDFLAELTAALPERNVGSVGMKASNVSAVMARLGYPYLDGFKPLPNIQKSLAGAVERGLAKHPILADVERAADTPVVESSASLREVKAPSIEPVARTGRRVAQSPDYAAREEANRSLGLAGELAVVEHIRKNLHDAGRADLADRVEHVSVTQGDGLGYDILGFDIDGSETYVEVKTTKRDRNWPFLVSAPEVAASKELGDAYRLYRVHNWESETGATFYVLRGDLEAACHLVPTTYSAAPR